MEKKTCLEKMVNISKKIIEKDLIYIHKNNYKKKFFRRKKILFLGSSGFLGFYFEKYFSKYLENLKIKKIYFADIKIKKNFSKNKKIRFIKFDITKEKIEKLKIKFDVIIHAASIASPIYYRKFPLETADANVLGTRKILEYSKKFNSKVKILYFSTSEIYGDPDNKSIPTSESYRGNVSCAGPRACYDESKRYSETLCYIYAKYFDVPVVVVRPFNNYGPGLNKNDGRLPADLANAIIKKNKIILYSDGIPTRAFCYIADAIVGFLNALTYKEYEVFNIGNDKEEISVRDLSKLYKKLSMKLFNFNTIIKFKKHKDGNYLKDNPQRRCPNIEKASKLIKFKPRITLSEGISNYLLYLKNEK